MVILLLLRPEQEELGMHPIIFYTFGEINIHN